MMNWYFGWGLILTAFLTGAILGLFFYREDFLEGYASFRRRILRLGHIALAARGMITVLYGLSPMASEPRAYAPQAAHILPRRLISSRGRAYDSPGTTRFMEESHA